MSANRFSVLLSILKGLLTAVVFTLAGMLIIAAVTVFIRISDGMLSALNQLLKIMSIILGTWASVGRGGHQGFVTGAVMAMLYMIAGYACYVLLGGEGEIVSMLGEILLGAAVGGLTGAVLANMQTKSRSRRRKA